MSNLNRIQLLFITFCIEIALVKSHTNGLDATISLSTTMTAENDDLNPVASTESSLSNLSAHMPIFKNGVFDNPWSTWKHMKIMNVVQFMLSKSQSTIPSSEKILSETLPVLKPKVVESVPDDRIRITWIGHATTLVQFEEAHLLTCPIFSERASPFQFMGPKRYRAPALSVSELPASLNAVLISHNHYDHLDAGSVQALNKRYGDRITWFVGVGHAEFFKSLNVTNVREMTWWEEVSFGRSMKVAFLPAQHWSKRGVLDTNRSLWGGFAVIGTKKRFYYAGDTGYNADLFKAIGHKYGPFDLAAIPIGAYEPNHFLRYQHVNPEQAFEIHKDIKSKYSVGVHWGTFDLAKEHYLEPRDKIQALTRRNPSEAKFEVFKHGEARFLTSTGDFHDHDSATEIE